MHLVITHEPTEQPTWLILCHNPGAASSSQTRHLLLKDDLAVGFAGPTADVMNQHWFPLVILDLSPQQTIKHFYLGFVSHPPVLPHTCTREPFLQLPTCQLGAGISAPEFFIGAICLSVSCKRRPRISLTENPFLRLFYFLTLSLTPYCLFLDWYHIHHYELKTEGKTGTCGSESVASLW